MMPGTGRDVMSSKTLLLYDERMLAHEAGPGHPERPQRLEAVCRELQRAPLGHVRWSEPQPADRTHLERIHHPVYLVRLEALRGTSARLDPDTAVSEGSVEAAYLAAGAAVDAVEAVVSGAAPSAFALVRPPGHHAEADRAMGFCLLNNIAVAAAHARTKLGCRRVLLVDWDVHHGNGTQHAFFDRADVLYFSSHRYPFYPGSGTVGEVGRDEGEGFTVNVPLPPGLDDADFIAVYRELLLPIADGFRPDLVLVSAGFDAHADDPLGGMNVTEEGFATVCRLVKEIADRHADGRLALILEGGYDLGALARSVRACVEVLGGQAPGPVEDGSPDARIVEVLQEVRDVHRRYWPGLAG